MASRPNNLIPMTRTYWVYIMSSRWRVIYVGVTNNLTRRVWQHKNAHRATFTGRYRVNRLVWYEEGGDIREMIAREKQLKAWSHRNKIALIASINPKWRALSDDWLQENGGR